MKNTYFKTALALAALVFVFACSDEDDLTGQSTLVPSNPLLSVEIDFPPSQEIVEMDATYDFTVTLSEPTIVAIDVKVAQTGGTATAGKDFEIPASVRIPAGATSATGTITILEDVLVEDTENAIITIGSEGSDINVSGVNAQTVEFTILNLTEGDLSIGLDWATAETITDNSGNEIGAYDAADLRLLLTATPDVDNILDEADGGANETYVLDGSAPDGDYYIVTDFYTATDIPVDLDLTLTFDQVGVIVGQTHNFDAALNTADFCADFHFVLAKVTKTGNSYAFEEIGEKSDVDTSSFVGDWAVTVSNNTVNGADENPFTTTLTDDIFYIDGIGQSFIAGFWGETVTASAPVETMLNSDGTVTIPRQYIYTTDYEGTAYDYEIEGTGTWNSCGSSNVLMLSYDIYYPGDESGIAADFSNFLNVGVLGGTFTLQ